MSFPYYVVGFSLFRNLVRISKVSARCGNRVRRTVGLCPSVVIEAVVSEDVVVPVRRRSVPQREPCRTSVQVDDAREVIVVEPVVTYLYIGILFYEMNVDDLIAHFPRDMVGDVVPSPAVVPVLGLVVRNFNIANVRLFIVTANASPYFFITQSSFPHSMPMDTQPAALTATWQGAQNKDTLKE